MHKTRTLLNAATVRARSAHGAGFVGGERMRDVAGVAWEGWPVSDGNWLAPSTTADPSLSTPVQLSLLQLLSTSTARVLLSFIPLYFFTFFSRFHLSISLISCT